jgi:hypothetical protein
VGWSKKRDEKAGFLYSLAQVHFYSTKGEEDRGTLVLFIV